MNITKEKAVEILSLVAIKRKELLNDKRASCHYWNGDGWGSMSGQRDAEEWVENNLATYFVEILDEAIAHQKGSLF